MLVNNMTVNNKAKFAAYLLVALAVLIGYHQYVNWGYWFEVKDIHHELFICMFAFSGLTLLFFSKNGGKKLG